MIKYIDLPETKHLFTRNLNRLGLEKTADQKKDEGLDKKTTGFIDKIKDRDSIHVLATAMGASPFWGANKNGDWFFEEDLFNDGPEDFGYRTFKTLANVFRHHKNSNPSDTFGKVEQSVYNPEMHRVELIIRIDRPLCEQKGHLDLFNQLLKNEHASLSMGCRVKFDLCSICNNPAKTRSDYCEHIIKNLNKILEDGRKVTMINPKPRFFDISFVDVPADTSARTLKFLDDYWSEPDLEVKKSELGKEKTAEEKIQSEYIWNGIKIFIEKRSGELRKGRGWNTEMKCHYGRIPRTKGNDGEQIDCYIRENPSKDKIYCILQIKETGQFDEEKFMIGFDSKEEAKKMYLKHIPEKYFGGIAEININQFKDRFNIKTAQNKTSDIIKKIPIDLKKINK